MGEPAALLDEADRLYALPLAQFTPTRDARARELKGEDPDLARAVTGLRKPSTAAWVVNLLVRRETDQVEQVLAVGAALRAAASNLDGEELRALTRQRRQLTAAVTTRARALAAHEGVRVTAAVADQVEATLTAAMIDESCGRAVRSGQLVTSLASTGVDAVDLAHAVALPGSLGFSAAPRGPGAADPEGRPDLHVVPDPDADAKARAAAEQELAAAQAGLAAARAALDLAAGQVNDLEAQALQLQAESDELRRRLADLETRAEDVDDELADAEESRAEAEQGVADALREHEAASAALARLV